RIARAPRAFLDGHRLARDLLGGAEHLTNAVPTADSQVVAQAFSRLKPLQSQEVRGRQVVDMDVIADTRAVGSRIVGAEYLQRWPLTQNRLQSQRNKMGFGIMILTDLAVGAGAGGVEITQGGVAPDIGNAVIGQGAFHVKLAVAVGVDRPLRL